MKMGYKKGKHGIAFQVLSLHRVSFRKQPPESDEGGFDWSKVFNLGCVKIQVNVQGSTLTSLDARFDETYLRVSRGCTDLGPKVRVC